MKLRRILILTGLATLALGSAAQAQTALSSDANMAVQITEARKANDTLMRQYTWNSRTELIENGQIKDTRIELCNYLPDGQLQRSLLNDTGAPLPRGFLRRAIAEDEKKKVEEFLTGLRSLLDQYTLPSAGKILDFMTSATTIGPDANGLVEMTGHNVVTPGDTLSIWTNARTRKTQRVLVNGFYKGDIVTLTGTFNTLPSGLNYMAFAEVTVPAKQMTLQVQNFDYQRPN
jgi:hypothetical protein